MIFKKKKISIGMQNHEIKIQEDKNTQKPKTNKFEDTCENRTSFCPKKLIKYKCTNMIPEYRPFIGLLRKTRKLTINLYAEYVNLSHKDNGIFKMSHCYNINESEQCDKISPYFGSFLENIGLSIQKCNYLNNSEILKQYMNDFYINFNSFLENNIQLIKNNDLRQLELTIKNQKVMRDRSIKHIKNDNCQLEKFFLRYMDKMDTMILKTIQKLNLNRTEQGIKDIKKKRIECRRIIRSKLSDSKNIYSNLKQRAVRMAETKLTNNQEITNVIIGKEDEFLHYEDYVDYVDDSYESNASDNGKGTINNFENKETDKNTSGLFKTLTSLESFNIKTDNYALANYDTDNVTDTTPSITNNYTESNMEDLRADIGNFIRFFLVVIVSLGVIIFIVGGMISVFDLFNKCDRKKKKQNINAESIKFFDIKPDK